MWSKNPKVAPIIINASDASNPLYIPVYAITIEIVTKNIVAIPPASPSSPSIKFRQFIRATINIIVKYGANTPKLR